MSLVVKNMKKNLKEFNNIYNEIKKVDKYKKLEDNIHHGITRIEHVERVAKFSYKVALLLKLDYKSVIKGALLHDFFIKEDIDRGNYNKFLKEHPSIALKNSKNHFKINSVEEDIIINHMYPLCGKKPETKEGLLVNIIDKIVSVYESIRYECSTALGIYLIFIYNIL